MVRKEMKGVLDPRDRMDGTSQKMGVPVFVRKDLHVSSRYIEILPVCTICSCQILRNQYDSHFDWCLLGAGVGGGCYINFSLLHIN